MLPIISFVGHSNSGKNQRLVAIFALISIIVFLCGCAKNNSNVQNTKENTNDTLYVNGKSVIFFSITTVERDSLVKSGVKISEIDEALSDFHHYSKIVMDSLNKTEIKCSVTSKQICKIINDKGENTIFIRSNKEHIVGAILADGKKSPIFYYGIATDVDYFDMIDNYFYKKQVK